MLLCHTLVCASLLWMHHRRLLAEVLVKRPGGVCLQEPDHAAPSHFEIGRSGPRRSPPIRSTCRANLLAGGGGQGLDRQLECLKHTANGYPVLLGYAEPILRLHQAAESAVTGFTSALNSGLFQLNLCGALTAMFRLPGS